MSAPFLRTTLAAVLTCCIALPASAALDARIQTAAEQAKAPTLTLLEQLVNIDSGSGYAPGLTEVGKLVSAELQKLGATVQEVPNTAPDQSKHLVATLKGSGKAKILLLAHMDTVFKEGTAKARPYRTEEKRAYGPGVSDDKGGIVVALAALKILKKLDFKDYGQITLLLDASEETGSQAATELIASTAKQHDVTLNLEPGRRPMAWWCGARAVRRRWSKSKAKLPTPGSRQNWAGTRRWKRRTRFCNWAGSAMKRRRPPSTLPCSRPVIAPT